MKTTQRERYEILSRLRDLGIDYDTANQLRRISMTLQRWFEYECGTENERGTSFCIERDGENGDGNPFMRVQYMAGNQWIDRRHKIPDRETGARKRLARIMAQFPTLLPYIQTDCRGAALYILRKADVPAGENVDAIYNQGVAVY